jgi:hypothetical protein
VNETKKTAKKTEYNRTRMRFVIHTTVRTILGRLYVLVHRKCWPYLDSADVSVPKGKFHEHCCRVDVRFCKRSQQATSKENLLSRKPVAKRIGGMLHVYSTMRTAPHVSLSDRYVNT